MDTCECGRPVDDRHRAGVRALDAAIGRGHPGRHVDWLDHDRRRVDLRTAGDDLDRLVVALHRLAVDQDIGRPAVAPADHERAAIAAGAERGHRGRIAVADEAQQDLAPHRANARLAALHVTALEPVDLVGGRRAGEVGDGHLEVARLAGRKGADHLAG